MTRPLQVSGNCFRAAAWHIIIYVMDTGRCGNMTAAVLENSFSEDLMSDGRGHIILQERDEL